MTDQQARAAFEEWNLRTRAPHRTTFNAFLAGRASVRAPEPATDEDNDDIDEAMSDAICDGDGRLYARHVRHHLAKHGLELVRKVTT